MKKQIALLQSILFMVGLVNAQTPEPGTLESLENQNRMSINSKVVNPSMETVGLSQIYSTTGNYTLSVDGIGTTALSMTIRVNKPNATATVSKAFLMSAVTASAQTNGCVTLSGVPVVWNGSATSISGTLFNNYWADVTSIVASQINSFPAGISNLAIGECISNRTDGEALLVIFNDAAATENTIIILFGAANPLGYDFSISLAEPIDPGQSGAQLDMGLGIGFGFQGTTQASQVSVNGQRLTSSAGGQDDGLARNGALLTVGGIGDLNTNPANPFAGPNNNPRLDDELYNILPFITNATTSLTISTINPSMDDNIFMTYFILSGAAIIEEEILLSQTISEGNIGTDHTVKAVVQNELGQPFANKPVTFSITSGPNSGQSSFTSNTNMNGEAYFTYTGTGGVGIDNIIACFTNSQNQVICSNVLPFEWGLPVAPAISCPAVITVGNDPSRCNARVSYLQATATGFPKPTITYSHPSGSFFPVGTTTVTATATNVNGTASCQFTITVTDDRPPVINTFNRQFCYEDGNFGCSYNLGVTATDNCQVVSLTSDAPACFPVGTTVVTWTAIDNHSNVATKTQTVVRNPEIQITICASPTLTIYSGTVDGFGPFGQQAVQVEAVATGGFIAYSYSWSPNTGISDPNIFNPLLFPTTTTTYTLTVTAQGGCTKQLSITVNVLPVSALVCSGSGNNLKFSVCHIPPGNPSNPENICISANAINAHLTSGTNGHNNCRLGPCVVEQLCVSTIPASVPIVNRGPAGGSAVTEIPETGFSARAFPNPSSTGFRVILSSSSDEPVTIRLIDVNGVVRSKQTLHSKEGAIIVDTKLNSGMYVAEITQGRNRKILKLVKVQ